MTINSGATLLTGIQTWLARTDSEVTTSDDDWITMAEARIAYGAGPPFPSPPLRCRANEAYTQWPLVLNKTTATTAGSGTVQTAVLAAYAKAFGSTLTVPVGVTNTGALTLNVNTQGATSVVKGQFDEALIAKDWVIGTSINLFDDGSNYVITPYPGAIPLPPDYLEMRYLWLGTNSADPLKYCEPALFFATQAGISATGKPVSYTIIDDCILLGPVPDTSYALHMLYWRKFVALGASTNTNWLITNCPSVYLYACLMEACLHLMYDERIAGLHGLYVSSVMGLNAQAQESQYPAQNPRGAAGNR